jgi:hypothetical protein
VLVVHKTTSESEMRDLDNPVICQCRIHQQLAQQEGGFAAWFTLNVSMVYSSMLTITTDGECLTCGGISLEETVCFGRLEFIADCFGGLSLSSRGATQALSS